MNSKYLIQTLPVLLAALILIACGSSENASDKSTESIETSKSSYDNPFEYCKAVGTIDTPGAEYNGPKVPELITQQLSQAFNSPQAAKNEVFIKGTFWRCMDGKVYACNVGANLPCEEKADVSKEPNEGMLNYCGDNPDTEFIPMYASGRDTVYEWKCDNGTPEIVKQIAETDKAGYIQNIWYEITP